jgi:DNA (cytosine-5)-methyltransferase 1
MSWTVRENQTVAIDLFAGLGGWSEGARRAGVRVAWAANHWPVAVQWHALNHPDTEHVCQDLHQANWSRVPPHDLLMASPACQGHSRARGTDRPHHDETRSTAWAVVACAEFHRPAKLIVENVPEFRDWILYPAWADALQRLGYTLFPCVVDAADCGAPQNRDRLFVVGTLDGKPPASIVPLNHRPASSFINFGSGRWSAIDKPGRAAATLERVEAGRAAFGDRFLASYYGNTKTGRSLDRPIGTITTRDRWAIIDGDRMRMLSVPEARAAMGFSDSYALPSDSKTAMHLLGNAVCPDAAERVIRSCMETIE